MSRGFLRDSFEESLPLLGCFCKPLLKVGHKHARRPHRSPEKPHRRRKLTALYASLNRALRAIQHPRQRCLGDNGSRSKFAEFRDNSFCLKQVDGLGRAASVSVNNLLLRLVPFFCFRHRQFLPSTCSSVHPLRCTIVSSCPLTVVEVHPFRFRFCAQMRGSKCLFVDIQRDTRPPPAHIPGNCALRHTLTPRFVPHTCPSHHLASLPALRLRLHVFTVQLHRLCLPL